MKAGDRVRVSQACKSLVAPKGMLGRLDSKAGTNPGAGPFLAGAWLVRLDNRELVLLWSDEFEQVAEQVSPPLSKDEIAAIAKRQHAYIMGRTR